MNRRSHSDNSAPEKTHICALRESRKLSLAARSVWNYTTNLSRSSARAVQAARESDAPSGSRPADATGCPMLAIVVFAPRPSSSPPPRPTSERIQSDPLEGNSRAPLQCFTATCTGRAHILLAAGKRRRLELALALALALPGRRGCAGAASVCYKTARASASQSGLQIIWRRRLARCDWRPNQIQMRPRPIADFLPSCGRD